MSLGVLDVRALLVSPALGVASCFDQHVCDCCWGEASSRYFFAVHAVHGLLDPFRVANFRSSCFAVSQVSVVAATEKEQLTANFVRNQLLSSLKRVDTDGNEKISQAEFESLLVNPHAARMVKEVGVDVVGLVELSDFIFQNEKELDLDDFFRLLLELRGSNNATVKDIVDMRKFMRHGH